MSTLPHTCSYKPNAFVAEAIKVNEGAGSSVNVLWSNRDARLFQPALEIGIGFAGAGPNFAGRMGLFHPIQNIGGKIRMPVGEILFLLGIFG